MAKENENKTQETTAKNAETKATAKKTKKVFIRKPEGVTAKAHVVGLNGVMFTVPYNKEVEVPLGVAENVERSQRYKEKAEAEKERIAAEARK